MVYVLFLVSICLQLVRSAVPATGFSTTHTHSAPR